MLSEWITWLHPLQPALQHTEECYVIVYKLESVCWFLSHLCQLHFKGPTLFHSFNPVRQGLLASIPQDPLLSWLFPGQISKQLQLVDPFLFLTANSRAISNLGHSSECLLALKATQIITCLSPSPSLLSSSVSILRVKGLVFMSWGHRVSWLWHLSFSQPSFLNHFRVNLWLCVINLTPLNKKKTGQGTLSMPFPICGPIDKVSTVSSNARFQPGSRPAPTSPSPIRTY